MNEKRRAQLRALVNKASPGPWIVSPSGTVIEDIEHCLVNCTGANARFIAAVNPETVLTLLDRLEIVERERDEARSRLESLEHTLRVVEEDLLALQLRYPEELE